MSRLSLKVFIISILLSSRFSFVFAAGEPGEIFAWGAGARSLGMGRAFLAVSDDASSSYWNHAAMIDLDRQEMTLLHSILWEDTNYNFIGYVYPMINRRAFGLNVVRQASAGFSKRDQYNTLLGDFGVSETGISMSYSQGLNRKLSIGAGVKYLTRSVDTYSNALYSIDMSMLYQLMEKTRAALRIENVLAFSGADTDDKLPVGIRLGLAQLLFKDKLIAGFDFEPGKWFLGGEMLLNPLAVRLGFNYEEITVGFGVAFKDYKLDYALSQHTLGLSHRLSVGMKFGLDLAKERLKKANALFKRAETSLEKGQFSAAINYYDEGLGLADDTQRSFENGRLRSVLKETGLKDIKSRDNLAERELQYILQSIKFYMQGDLMSSLRQAKKGLEMYPENKMLIRMRDILKREGYDEVQDEMTGDALIAVRLQRALNYFVEKKYDLAIKECMDAVEMDPDNVLAHERLGTIYYKIGMKAKALQEWNKALEMQPENNQLRQFIEKMQ